MQCTDCSTTVDRFYLVTDDTTLCPLCMIVRCFGLDRPKRNRRSSLEAREIRKRRKAILELRRHWRNVGKKDKTQKGEQER
jgi:hypothetical protein